jgi:hypothetical protein
MRLELFTKKTLPFFILFFLLVTLSCIHKPEIIKQNTETVTETENVPYELLGKKYSTIYREIIEKYGRPQTLVGTNNGRWVAYFPKGDFTIVSDDRTSTINAVLPGRKPQ